MSIAGGRQRQALAEALKRLRVASGLSGRDLAPVLGVTQSVVSRIENDKQRATVAQVLAWSRATGADEARTAELVALATDILVGRTRWGVSPKSGTTDHQIEVAELEAKATTVLNYRPAALPGLVQTDAYALRLYQTSLEPLSEDDIAQRILRRAGRQRVLYDETKRYGFVIPEVVLRWPLGPDDEHLEQLDRVAAVLGRPNVEIGILPVRPAPMPPVWRFSGFVLYDDIPGEDPFVHIELPTDSMDVTDPDGVEVYRRAYERLRAASVFGDDAHTLISQVAEDMRRRA